ncbi:MAG: RNA polymerase sigma factor [Planctomycetota bacterium]
MTTPASQPPDPGASRRELAALCQRHYPAVYDRVHRLLARDIRRGRPWLSAMLSTGDLVHEVFLGVVRDFDGFRGDGDEQFVAYLARLTRNRLIDSVRYHEAERRDSRRGQVLDPEACHDAPSPVTVSMQREEVERVFAILATFPERDRALLRGRIDDGETFAELASALGYASADSARKSFRTLQARLLARLQLEEGQG